MFLAAAAAAKVLHNRLLGKPQFLLHGNYTGPGNPISRSYRASRPPVDALDRASLEHDLQYDQYLKKGRAAYTRFNQADARYLERIDRLPGFSARLARGAFKAKRFLTKPLVEDPKPLLRSGFSSNSRAPAPVRHTVISKGYPVLTPVKTYWFKTYKSRRNRRKRRKLW